MKTKQSINNTVPSNGHRDISLTITKDSPPIVVCSADAAAPVIFAAEELKRYLGVVLEADLPSEPGDGIPEIHLAQAANPELGDEGIEFVVRDNSLHINSPSAASVLFGVYEFLRRFCGCRFSGAGPDCEHVPVNTKIELSGLPLCIKPEFWHRALQLHFVAPVERIALRVDWMAKNGLNYLDYNVYDDTLTPNKRATLLDPETGEVRDEDFGDFGRLAESVFNRKLLPEIRKRGMKLATVAHNLLNFLPPEKYFNEHPEWYMLQNGKRVAGAQLCICTSNRDMVGIYIQNVLQYLRTHPDVTFLSIGPMDGYGCCECDNCRAMDEKPDEVDRPIKHHRSPQGENPGKIRRYARFLNDIARAVRGEFPDILVGYQGYIDLNFAPRGVVLEDNIVVKPSNYWRCAAHSIAPDTCPANRFFHQNMMNWRAAHKGDVIMGDNFYMGMHCQKALPYPVDEVICEDWMRYKKLGIAGDYAQLNDGSFEAYGLNYTALARSAWHHKVDSSAMLVEYLEGMFGSAGPALRPIYDSFHETIRRIREHGKSLSVYLQLPTPPIACEPPEKLAACLEPNGANIACFMDELGEDKLDACIRAAEQTAQTDRERRQLRVFAAVAEYWRRTAAYYRLYWPLLVRGKHFSTDDLPRLKQALATCESVVEYVEKFPWRGLGWMNRVDLKSWQNEYANLAARIKKLNDN